MLYNAVIAQSILFRKYKFSSVPTFLIPTQVGRGYGNIN